MAQRKPRPTIREENERALLEAAEAVFAEQGFAGATTAAIARRAGVPKANLHYYFRDQGGALSRRGRAGADRLARRRRLVRHERRPARGARAPISAPRWTSPAPCRSPRASGRPRSCAARRSSRTSSTRRSAEWVASRERAVKRWIAAGKLKPIEPKVLFYMIWATTQQYANAAHEMATLNGGRPLDDAAFERAKRQVIETILGGVAA